MLVEQLAQPDQSLPPEFHQRQQVTVAGRCQRGGRLVAGLDALVEKSLHFGDEDRTGQLIGENRGEADGDRRGHVVRRQAAERFQQRQVGVERRLADPVAAMGPAPMVQHVGQVAVQREDEVRRTGTHRAPGE